VIKLRYETGASAIYIRNITRLKQNPYPGSEGFTDRQR